MFDTILTYNEVVNYLNNKVTNEDGEYWEFWKILGIQHTHHGQKDKWNSKYNVKMLWETGKITYEPLNFLTKDIPVELVQYAIENNLLNKSGWKLFKRYNDTRNKLNALSVKLNLDFIVFKLNTSMVMINSAKFSDARLHKRHNILSFHCCQIY